MGTSWPVGVAVVVVGGLAGSAIAWRPAPRDPFVLEPSITAAESPSTSAAVVTSTVATTITSAPTTVAATLAPTTTEVLTATTDPRLLPRGRVQLVIAEGDEGSELGTVADRLRGRGYTVAVGETSYRVDETVVLYRPGFDGEATKVANDIGVPDAVILEMSTDASQPITNSDASGDIIIVLGPDAPR